MSWRAERANAKGIALEEKGWIAEAEAAYRKAAALDPAWPVPWFNLGLLAKRQRRWAESLEYNRRAVELNAEDEGAWWNLGIAATALGDWATARQAWSGCGMSIPAGEGPLVLDFGLVPIRVSEGEVVWCKRIDPARAYIRSVPLPEAGRRYGDLVLHDGAANGWRWLHGKEVPVFDELEVLTPSEFRTYEIRVRVSSPGDVDRLVNLAMELSAAAEDWSTIRVLCEACSQGRPDEHHLHEAPAWSPDRRIGLAATHESVVQQMLDRWRSEVTAVVSGVEVVLES